MSDHWYDPLRAVTSLGSKREKIENMGGLAAARRKHLGQYFTQDDTAAFMWKFVEDLPITTLLDNSIGSGRLFQYALPGKHALFGVDVHAQTVTQVMATVDAAGFAHTILHAGMEDINPRYFSCALINPPFSLHLNSQSLEKFEECTTMGKLGPHTSAMSDQYALRQALKAATIVIALMPKTRALELVQSDVKQVSLRLRAIYHLPKRSFAAEGTEVDTSVMVFGDYRLQQDTRIISLTTLPAQVEEWGLGEALSKPLRGVARLNYVRAKAVKPAINVPVTGNKIVTVHLDGRKIRLKFACGLTQAKVLNHILVKQVFSYEHHRLPAGIRYDGQGRLDLMAYMVQDDPLTAFAEFLQMIEQAGGIPVPHASVWPAVEKRSRETKRALTPFRRTVWSKGNVNVDAFTATARQTQAVFPNSWISPIFEKGEVVHFTRIESGNFVFEKKGKTYELGTERIEALFDMGKEQEGWETIHAGKHSANPQHAILLRKRAESLGIHTWLNWKFQLDDLIEIFTQPSNVGSVVGWEQACGKSRLGAALILLSGVKHGLMVVESRLVQEMQKMLALLPIDQKMIHVIDSPDAINHLKTINIISYERLRMAVDSAKPLMTYAKKMRRRIGLVIPDEAEKLANLDSDQSRALFQLSARRKIPMSGTPVANYPRDIHGLLLFVGGDATPVQPYGYRRGFLNQSWLRGMAHSTRGIEKLADDFVVLEWATNEFMETLSKGAKREVPKIKNLDAFRSWVSPLMKRRVVDEPDVKPYLNLPPIEQKVIMLEWDPVHLAHYLRVADDFAQWYKADQDGKRNRNLALLLAKINAVHQALNVPQADPTYQGGLTSKQRFEVQRLIDIAGDGKKSLLFCNNPQVVDILARELKRHGVKSVKFTGKQSIKARNIAKEEDFIRGDVPHLLATIGCARSGINLPQADFVLFYDRCWSFRTQDQAIKRPRRTERKTAIHAEFLHLPGSLDIYQDQLVAFKKDATQSGIDWATPELNEVEFMHLTTVLDRFVDDLASMHQVSHSKMREQLKEAA